MKIGDVFTFIRNGANIKQGGNETGYPITRIETISNRVVDRQKMGYVGIENIDKYKDFVLQDGDILMSHINSETHLGKTALYERVSDEVIIHGMNLLCLRPDTNQIIPKYAFYYLNSERFLRQIPRITKKSVNQSSFNVSSLKNLYFHVVSKNEQNDIVMIFDKINNLISLRNQQLQKLDDLIKARFIEMFGDPFSTTRWQVKRLKEVSESISDGSNIEKSCYQESGDVLFLRIQNVWCNEFRLEDSVYISKNVNQKYIDTSLHTGDLLITKIGRYYTQDSSLGRVSVYLGENDKANYSNNIMRVRLKKDVLSEYINALMNLDNYNQYIRKISVGGTDKRALSKTLIGDFPIIIPPMEMQIEYIEFINQIDKTKIVVQKALDEAETLFDSLMQQYFD